MGRRLCPELSVTLNPALLCMTSAFCPKEGGFNSQFSMHGQAQDFPAGFLLARFQFILPSRFLLSTALFSVLSLFLLVGKEHSEGLGSLTEQSSRSFTFLWAIYLSLSVSLIGF